jgi:hypothetical protein
MFWSAFSSFILYSLVFVSLPTNSPSALAYTLVQTKLRLRGNIIDSGSGVRLRWVKLSSGWKEQDPVESFVMTVARQMLWYPVAYTLIILPIAACRWAEFSGKTVPYWVTVFSGVIFGLSGKPFFNPCLIDRSPCGV